MLAINVTDIRKNPCARSMGFKKIPEFTKYYKHIEIAWLYWIIELGW